jgi:hypothetical protein
MTEEEFVNAVDGNFPFRHRVKWRALSSKAARISPNAAFMVLHEVCRLPVPRNVTLAERPEIIAHLKRRFRHPALRVIRPAMLSYLGGNRLRPSTAAALMHRLEPHVGQYNALIICHYSADDRQGALERTHRSIVQAWSTTNQGRSAARREAPFGQLRTLVRDGFRAVLF